MLRFLLVGILALTFCQAASAEYKVKVKFPWLHGEFFKPGLGIVTSKVRLEVPNPGLRSAHASRGVLTLSLSNSKAKSALIRAAIEGRELLEIEILVADPSRELTPSVYSAYRLDHCSVKSWLTASSKNDSTGTEFEFHCGELSRIPAHTPEWTNL